MPAPRRKPWPLSQHKKINELLKKHKGIISALSREIDMPEKTLRTYMDTAPKGFKYVTIADFKVIAPEQWEVIIKTLDENRGNRELTAKILGYSYTQFRRIVDTAPQKYAKRIRAPQTQAEAAAIDDATLHECWSVYESYQYNVVSAAEALSMPPQTMTNRIKTAMHKFGYEKRPLGRADAQEATRLALPLKGDVKRYLLTCAQNNTAVHLETWKSLIQLARFYDASIKVSTFTYMPNLHGSAKRGKESEKIKKIWYDPIVLPFISDEFEQLAPGLVWNGHHNTLPTAADPLRGTENLNGRSSGVFPHPRIEMRPVATAAGEGTKFNWTTGSVTLRNYIQKRVGIMAEFYHCFGALLVEVDAGGNWWCRQLNADTDGVIYDLDIYATPDGVWENEEGVEGIKFGDIHVDNTDPVIVQATFGKGGVVDTLKPKSQFLDDLLDFESRGHHNRKDPHKMFSIYQNGRDSVWDEVRRAGEFVELVQAAAPDSKVYITDSNHDRHFDRYLKEADWRQDMPNAKTILKANLAIVDSIIEGTESEFHLLDWAWGEMGVAPRALVLNQRSHDPAKLSVVLCPERGDGIEMALHGDQGPNGSRGTPRALSKIGRKNVIGHSHSPGIWGGTYQTGATARLKQGYNVGPSSWAHAHCVVYPNGKRQIILFWDGRPWADR